MYIYIYQQCLGLQAGHQQFGCIHAPGRQGYHQQATSSRVAKINCWRTDKDKRATQGGYALSLAISEHSGPTLLSGATNVI